VRCGWRRRALCARKLEDARLKERIAHYYERSHGTYGSPRLASDLADEGIRVSRKRVARLMRELGIAGVSGREGRRRRRKAAAPESEPATDLVRRDFTAGVPNRVWFADVTYVPTWEGWLFLAVVMDACTKRIVGWSMRDDLKAEIVIDALGMGTTMRRPEPGLVHHSDSEYVPTGFLAWPDPHSDRHERMCRIDCPRWPDPHSDRPFACHSSDVSATRGQPVEVPTSADARDLMRA